MEKRHMSAVEILSDEFDIEDILDFTHHKFQKWARHSVPFSAAWEVTNACNLRCKYCGLSSGNALSNELSLEEAFDVIEDISQAGTHSLMLLGGEPLVRSDVLEIAGYASLFMSVGINTNGLLLDEEFANKLKTAGINQVKVSLDGPKSHDVMRGTGTYEKALRALKACKNAGIFTIIEMTVSRLNYNEVPAVVNLAMRLGAAVVVNEFIPFGRGEKYPELMLSREERKRMQEFLLERKKLYGEWRIAFEDRYIISEDAALLKMVADPFCNAVNVGCNAGIFAYGITPDGKVLPCPTLRLTVGDLRERSLKDIWKDSEALKTLRSRELKGKCGRCELRYVCGGCRGRTYAFTNDILAEDPLCWYEPALGGGCFGGRAEMDS
ncbi:MAG: Radical SAM superfamily maturase [Candidatus Alkanophagales archaeon MCA70_species_2]|nr:Radical SAM superfamily maturase [Candidatus Alkanophaga liquidiphilum]